MLCDGAQQIHRVGTDEAIGRHLQLRAAPRIVLRPGHETPHSLTDYDWLQFHASRQTSRRSTSGARRLRRHSRLCVPASCSCSSFTLRAMPSLVVGFSSASSRGRWASPGGRLGQVTVRTISRPCASEFPAIDMGRSVQAKIRPSAASSSASPSSFPQDQWIPAPSDFSSNIVQGKGHDADSGAGQALWHEVRERLELLAAQAVGSGPLLVPRSMGLASGSP